MRHDNLLAAAAGSSAETAILLSYPELLEIPTRYRDDARNRFGDVSHARWSVSVLVGYVARSRTCLTARSGVVRDLP